MLLFSLAVAAGGCNRLPERPDGLPPLHPCQVTVTFGGEPKENVTVSLIAREPGVKWKAGGRTDKNGVVELRTSFAFPGAPEGRYTIAFSKTRESVGNTIEEMTPVSVIPLKYGPKQSKETVEIKKGKNKFAFALEAGEERLPIPRGARSLKMPVAKK